MNSQVTNDIRELTADELDAVAGGLRCPVWTIEAIMCDHRPRCVRLRMDHRCSLITSLTKPAQRRSIFFWQNRREARNSSAPSFLQRESPNAVAQVRDFLGCAAV